MSVSLIDVIVERCDRAPERPCLAVVGDDGRETVVTAGELATRAIEYAAALAGRGIAPGDVLLISLDHSLDLVTVFLGAMYAGAIPCLFPSRAPRLDPAAYVQRLGAAARRLGPKAIVTQAMPAAGGALPCVAIDVASLTADARGARRFPRAAAGSDCAFLQLSSGTTAHQKAIRIGHHAVLNLVAARDRALGLTADDVVVGWVPFYHDLGLVGSVLAPLVSGVFSVAISPLYWLMHPASLLHAIHRHRGTICTMPNFAFPYCARRIADEELRGVDLSHWRVLANSAEPIRLDSFSAFANRFARWGFDARAFVTGYGLAETTLTVALTPLRRPPLVDWIDRAALQQHEYADPRAPLAGATAVVSCGGPLANVTLQIRSESGAALPDRHVGEVVVRCNYLFDGYLHDAAATAAAVRDGWLYTGDLGYMAGGELYICGRKKDLIIVAGSKVHAEDVELIASGVNGVRAGRIAAFGVPDPARGTEQIVVVTELDPDARQDPGDVEREIRRRVKQELDVVLGHVELARGGWIMKTTSGKVARWQNRSKWLADQERAQVASTG